MEQNQKLKPISQHLRKNATKEENLLWYNFLRLYKPQFRRQYVIGNYIVDFYCHRAKLVVELDGSQHCEPKKIIRSGEDSIFGIARIVCT
jgi:very-short-patch-repair endonuclease